MSSKISSIINNDEFVEGIKTLATDSSVRKRAKKLTSELREEVREVFCVKKTLGIHAKRSVTFA